MIYRHKTKAEKILLLWPLIVAFLFIQAVSFLDGRLFPVVSNFTVTNQQQVGHYTLVLGYMSKERSCKFIAVDATAVTEQGEMVDIPLKFLDNDTDDSASRPIGTQQWGWWQILVPVGTNVVTFIAYHECNILWTTKTKLVKFIVTKEKPHESARKDVQS